MPRTKNSSRRVKETNNCQTIEDYGVAVKALEDHVGARAATGQAVAAPTMPLMKSRRRIATPKAQGLCGLCIGRTQLQQGFTSDEMGSDRAWQSSGPNVRFGS